MCIKHLFSKNPAFYQKTEFSIAYVNKFSSVIIRFIDEEDLLRFMKKVDVENVIPLFDGAAEKKRIKRSALKNWLVSFISFFCGFSDGELHMLDFLTDLLRFW